MEEFSGKDIMVGIRILRIGRIHRFRQLVTQETYTLSDSQLGQLLEDLDFLKIPTLLRKNNETNNHYFIRLIQQSEAITPLAGFEILGIHTRGKIGSILPGDAILFPDRQKIN